MAGKKMEIWEGGKKEGKRGKGWKEVKNGWEGMDLTDVSVAGVTKA